MVHQHFCGLTSNVSKKIQFRVKMNFWICWRSKVETAEIDTSLTKGTEPRLSLICNVFAGDLNARLEWRRLSRTKENGFRFSPNSHVFAGDLNARLWWWRWPSTKETKFRSFQNSDVFAGDLNARSRRGSLITTKEVELDFLQILMCLQET